MERAARAGHFKVVRAPIRAGADLDDLLLLTVWTEDAEPLKQLLIAGANPSITKTSGGIEESLMYLAAITDNSDIVRALINAGSSQINVLAFYEGHHEK